MTEEIKQEIIRLYDNGILYVVVAGHWAERPIGQAKETIIVHNDLYYKLSQRRIWRSSKDTLDAFWEYREPRVVQVVYKTKVKKIVSKFWKEL